MQKTIYVAGPLTLGDTISNVKEGIRIGNILAEKGYIPYIPHLCAFWHLIHQHNYEFWMTIGIEWLNRCDALYRIPGKSEGADREVEKAKELGIPIYYNLAEVE